MTVTINTLGPGIGSQVVTELNPVGVTPAPVTGPTFGGGPDIARAPVATGPTFCGGAPAAQTSKPPSGYSNAYYRDTTTTVGGTPGAVNTCVTAISTVGVKNTAFEWTALHKLDNFADAGENVAHYAQANKNGLGPTWARCAESCSTDPIPGAQVTDEVDVWVSGPSTGDKGASDLTVGDGRSIRNMGKSDVAEAHFAQRVAACLNTPWARFIYGYIVTAFKECGMLLDAVATRAIQLKGEYVVGIDFSTAKTQSAIRLAPGQRMTFEATDQISWSWLDGRLRVQNGSINVLEIDTTTGDIYKRGVKVL